MIKYGSLRESLLGIKVQNIKIDFNTSGTQRRVKQTDNDVL